MSKIPDFSVFDSKIMKNEVKQYVKIDAEIYTKKERENSEKNDSNDPEFLEKIRKNLRIFRSTCRTIMIFCCCKPLMSRKLLEAQIKTLECVKHI